MESLILKIKFQVANIDFTHTFEIKISIALRFTFHFLTKKLNLRFLNFFPFSKISFFSFLGHRSWRRAEGVQGPERSCRCNQPIAVCPPTALFADSQHNQCWKELYDYFPASCGHYGKLYVEINKWRTQQSVHCKENELKPQEQTQSLRHSLMFIATRKSCRYSLQISTLTITHNAIYIHITNCM